MKAKEAAKKVVNENLAPGLPVAALIPEYGNPLHKRQWIHNFIKSLPAELRERHDEAIRDLQN